jgi:Flp pilus assembly protein TadG
MGKQRTTATGPRRARRAVRRGSALLELALVLPFLAALLLGVADIGRAYAEQVAVTEAAHQGARVWAITSGDTDAFNQAIDNTLSDPDLIARAYLRDPVQDTNAGTITVTISYHYNLLFGFFDDLVGSAQLTFSNSATMPLGVTGP